MRRLTYVANRLVLADSGEITVPVGLRDPITALTFDIRATNGATGNAANPVSECVQSIELVDGANVLCSLSGVQLEALTMYDHAYMPYLLHSEIPSNVQNMVGVFKFGRWYGDPSYSLDPARFSNLQVRVKWNLATNRAVGATGYVTGTATLSIVAEVMEGAPAPQAVLTAKQIYSFTTAASGTEYVQLPTDQKIKAILLRSYGTGGGGLYGLSNVKLNADQDKFIPLNVSVTDLQRLFSLKNPPIAYKHGVTAKSGDTFYPILKKDEIVTFSADTGDTVISYHNDGIGNGALAIYTGGVAASGLLNLWAIVQGWQPYATLLVDQGEYDDPASWLDATVFKRLTLELTQNAASSLASVVLQQEYVY